MTEDELGPDSLLWQYAGDRRSTHVGGTIGLLQLMHPAIGAGVVQHSNFFANPLDRVARSLPAILGAVYDGPGAEATGDWVRNRHASIAGQDSEGREYHALNPETFWWAHATFQYMVEQVVDRFDKRILTPGERERLYQDGLIWYRRYGVSDRDVPPTRDAFQAKWDHYCSDVLERNQAVDYVLETLKDPFRLQLPGIAGRLHPILRRLPSPRFITGPAQACALGGLPVAVRERFDLPFTESDQRILNVIEWTSMKAWRFLPARIRWHGRAREGWRRVGVTPP